MKVTEYKGHKVPKGSTKVGLNLNGSFAFYEMAGKNPSMFCNVNKVWQEQPCHDQWNAATELPEQPAKADEWVPVVGEECKISNCGNPFEVSKILFMGKEMCVVNHPHFKAIEQHYHLSSIEFRPLKTADEKKREVFIDAAQACTEGTLFDNDDPEVVAFIDNLLKAGFAAPKGGE